MRTFVTMMAMLFTLSPAMYAGRTAKTISGGPATSVVYDSPSAAGVDPLDTTPYRIHSDLPRGGSNTYYNGVDSVVSQFQSTGAYELSTLQSSARSLWLDLNDPVDSSSPAPAEVLGDARAAYVPGRFISKVSGIDTMRGVDSTIVGGLPFVFTCAVQGPQGGSADYQVRMNSAIEPGTTDAIFRCTHVIGSDQSDPTALCNEWLAVPDATTKAVGRLVRQQTVKGKVVLTYYGDFYVTYRVTITKP